MLKRCAPLLILLLAFALRVYQIDAIPPGLTHDEANHGREALEILGGHLALFFPLNYGSEPLYSYAVALNMWLTGGGLFALRMVNVYFGLLAVAATYLWTRRVLDRPTGLLAAALVAVSFWPLALSREALRAGMMPFFTILAAFFFWRLIERPGPDTRRRWLLALGLSLAVAATLYNYLAARVVWLLFPLFLVYLALFHRPVFLRSWRPVLGALLLSGLLVVPMFWYLENHPEMQTRLSMFNNTFLSALLEGDVQPLLRNISGALLGFVWPGAGDQFLAYNIPGRPTFEMLSAIFFVVGVLTCLWRWRRPVFAFLLLWFLVGIIPSLLTGATAGTTRNVGALAPTFILPAVGFVSLVRLVRVRWPVVVRPAGAVAVLWLLVALGITTIDYFERWAQAPEVRAAYQHTLMAALEDVGPSLQDGPLIISSIYPGPAHNPSIGLVTSGEQAQWRWVDGRLGLLLPGGEGVALLALAETPLHPLFVGWAEVQEQVSLRPDDLSPGYTLYTLEPPAGWLPTADPVDFGQEQAALRLMGTRWLAESVRPGEVAELLSVWQVLDPAGVGPFVPPSFTSDVVLFTHVLAADGTILTQQDRLDAPSWDWQAGDFVVQIHQMQVPAEATPDRYEVVAGVYDRTSEVRLPLWASRPGEDNSRAFIAPLVVSE